MPQWSSYRLSRWVLLVAACGGSIHAKAVTASIAKRQTRGNETMQIIDFYKRLFLAPEPIATFGHYSTSTLAMIVPLAILGWILALALYQLLSSNRETMGEWLSVRLGWAWASALLGSLILVDIVILWIQARVVSWSAVSPHATVAALAGFVALLVYLGARGELKASQRALFRAQRAGQ